MPLIKSKSNAAFKKNVRTLMNDVGNSPHVQSRQQALAIAYATKRRGRARGGMADGGDPAAADWAPLPQQPPQPWPGDRDPAIANSPYFSEGEDAINRALIQRDLDKLHKRGIAPGDISTAESTDRFNRLHGAASFMGLAGGIAPAATTLGTEFYGQHADDPNWKEALANQAIPMAASMAAGPLGRVALSKLGPAAAATTIGGLSSLAPSEIQAGDFDPNSDPRMKALLKRHEDEVEAAKASSIPPPAPALPSYTGDSEKDRLLRRNYNQQRTDWKKQSDSAEAAREALPGALQELSKRHGSEVNSLMSTISGEQADAASNSLGGEAWWQKAWNQPISKSFPPIAVAAPAMGAYSAFRSPYKVQSKITQTFNDRAAQIENNLDQANKLLAKSVGTKAQEATARDKSFALIQDAKGMAQTMPPSWMPAPSFAGNALKSLAWSFAPQEVDAARIGTDASRQALETMESWPRTGMLSGIDTALALAGMGKARSGIAAPFAGRLSSAQETYANRFPMKAASKRRRTKAQGLSETPSTPADTAGTGTPEQVPPEERPWLLPGWSETRAAGGRANTHTVPAPQPSAHTHSGPPASTGQGSRQAPSLPSGDAQASLPRGLPRGYKTGGASMSSVASASRVSSPTYSPNLPPRQYAIGGAPSAPWWERRQAAEMTHSGPIVSSVPGRTDKINMSVKSGSYVLPAETVSHLGQSNSIAGLKIAGHMFGGRGTGLPKPPAPMMKFANGGEATGHRTVPIVAAGGEFVVEPSAVARIGGGDIDRGHKILDAFVLHMRKQHLKTIAGLKPPAKD